MAFTTATGTPPVMAANNPRDLNNDGKTDLLFQNTGSGQLYVYYMNGAGVINSGGFFAGGQPVAPFKIVGTADLNSDGNADLLFQHSGTSQLYAWYLNSAGLLDSGGYFAGGQPLGDFKVVSTADLNSDGKADVLFQNNAGQLYVWYMNGAGVISSGDYYAGGQALGNWRAFAR